MKRKNTSTIQTGEHSTMNEIGSSSISSSNHRSNEAEVLEQNSQTTIGDQRTTVRHHQPQSNMSIATSETTTPTMPEDIVSPSYDDSINVTATGSSNESHYLNDHPSTFYARRRNSVQQKRSSLSLRRIPMDDLLKPDSNFYDLSELDDVSKSIALVLESDQEKGKAGGGEEAKTAIQDQQTAKTSKTCLEFARPLLFCCLSPKFKLKTQLMWSFGGVNVLTIVLVIATCILVSFVVGENVKQINQNAFEDKLAREVQATTIRYLAESFHQQFMPLDLIDILEEAVQDRFLGYPESLLVDQEQQRQQEEGGQKQPHVDSPFHDLLTGHTVYPIVGEPMLLDWQIPQFVTEDNYEEHVQQVRWDNFMKTKSAASTAHAKFSFQGNCDPSLSDEMTSSSPYYLPNCTSANNNLTTGGVIQPVPITGPIHNAGKDIVPLLKAMYESTPVIRDLGLYFSSMGAGALMNFPAFPYETHSEYTSIGCEWMATPSPLDPRLGPIGTPEEIRRCHPKDESVSNRLYNPLERSWCRNQALNPKKTHIESYIESFAENLWIISIGRALYDRETKAFIACMYIGISLSSIQQKMKESLVTANSALSLIRVDEAGTVVASTADTLGAPGTDLYTIDKLRVGLSSQSYQTLYALSQTTSGEDDSAPGISSNYYRNKTWDPQSLRQAYEQFSILDDGYLVTVAPIPRVPDEYDEYYKPEFLIVMSSSTEDVFEGVQKLNSDVNAQVRGVVWFSLFVGAIGLSVTTAIIILMGNAITAPLRYINAASDDIINNFGETATKIQKSSDIEKSDEENDNQSGVRNEDVKDCDAVMHKHSCYTPKTELSDVLDEFNLMVANFSGSLLTKSEKGKRIEVQNKFSLQREFSDLYASRRDVSFPYHLNPNIQQRPEQKTGTSATGDFLHRGSNIKGPRASHASDVLLHSNSKKEGRVDVSVDEKKKRFSSRLFIWTVALIVTPLLLTTITVATVVYNTATHEFGQSVQNAKTHYIDVRLHALSVHATLRADFVSGLVGVSVRDLYLLTRYYGWLFFGGVKRADSYTEMLSGAESCKAYSDNISACPYVQEHFQCDCAWNDARGFPCTHFPSGSRHLHRLQFGVESSDALPDGDRNFTSFPLHSVSPNTTQWWDDPQAVPGWERGSSAGGYDTLYDRLRTSSAMPLIPVLYNYARQKNDYLGQYITFEADGMLLGYSGCAATVTQSPFWQSTKTNGGSKIRPDLCPIGKFGFDARCRKWYDTGRKLAIESNSSLHITAPYVFAGTGENAQSATSPLVDPRTGEHVGQVVSDFFSTSVFQALDNTIFTTGGFPILIALEGDPDEDTIIGPGFALGDESKGIIEVVLNMDRRCRSEACQSNVAHFEGIVASMKAGATNITMFKQLKPNGKTETIHVSHAPVSVKSLRPLDSSNFSRGIEVNEYLVYSLGLCESEEDIEEPFRRIEQEMDQKITWAISIVGVGIILAAMFVIFISYLVTESITEPMIYLLHLIRCINRIDVDDDPPKFDHPMGSMEMEKVSDTVLVLYKIVRTANNFFFSGELEMAYVVLEDALRLFKKLDNNKAVAVASNNLGNILLAIYCEMRELGLRKHCGLTIEEVIAKGKGHFHRTITLGEKAYDTFYETEGWTPNCLDFMQHLANRYFNRGLFLLTVKDDHELPDEIKKLGVRDLEIARDMDFEVVEFGEDVGFNRENRANKLFHNHLSRARGHNMLLEMGYPDDVTSEKGYPEDWELGDRLDENFKLLQTEFQRDSSELFEDVNALGRLQEIEAELMKYKKLAGDLDTAARIAIRMLYEDAFAFAWALWMAVEVLIAYTDTMVTWDDATQFRVKKELVSYAKKLYEDYEAADEVTRGSSTYDSLPEKVSFMLQSGKDESNEHFSQKGLSLFNCTKRLSLTNWVKKRASGGFVTMEDF